MSDKDKSDENSGPISGVANGSGSDSMNARPVKETAKPKSELQLRVISAIVLAIVVLGLTWIGGRVFYFMCAGAALLVYYEYSTIVKNTVPPRISLFGAPLLVILLAAHIYNAHYLELPFFLLSMIGLGLWEMLIRRSAWSALGFAYAYIPFLALTCLRGDVSDGLVLVLLAFGIVWGADIAAYFTGRAIGGPKLAPSISPGKTWSGFFGGLAGSLVLSFAVVLFAGYGVSPWFVVIVLLASIFSQVGDLFESKIKRVYNVKDSGKLIPGHGGILDRIDGLIFAVGFLAAIGWWFGSMGQVAGETEAIVGLRGLLLR